MSLLYGTFAAALAVLGVRSLFALRGAPSPWTRAGWFASTMYCLIADVRLAASLPGLPWHGEYVVLGVMAIAFVVAGVRREPQADPWWWPTRALSGR